MDRSSILVQLDFGSIGHSEGRITGVHVQWNPVNLVTNGLQKYGRIKGVAKRGSLNKKITEELLFGPE